MNVKVRLIDLASVSGNIQSVLLWCKLLNRQQIGNFRTKYVLNLAKKTFCSGLSEIEDICVIPLSETRKHIKSEISSL